MADIKKAAKAAIYCKASIMPRNTFQ